MNKLSEIENLRKKCPYIIYLGIASIILNLIFSICFLASNNMVFLILLIIFLLLGLSLFLFSYTVFNKVKNNYRDYLLFEIEKNIIPQAKYTLNNGLPLDEIYKSGLLQVADKSKTKNLMVGVVEGVDFFSSNLYLEERRVHTDKNGNRNVSYVSYFKGKVLIFDFLNKFKSNLIITSSSPIDETYKLKKLDIKNDLTINNYKIYSDNLDFAKIFLNDEVIDLLLKLGLFNKDSLMLSINKNKLYIAIDNVDINLDKIKLFEPLTDYPLTYVRERMDLIKDLVNIIKAKDIFK